MMDKYQKKQFKIGLVYLLIFVIIAGGVYLIIGQKVPSCSDGIQNQGEAGIDCGVPCALCPWQLQKDLEIISSEAIKTKDNYVDLVAKIKNPNPDFGAKTFSYVFSLYDSQGSLIVSQEGVSYILPRETRYIIEQKVLVYSARSDLASASDLIHRVEFKVTSVVWKELVGYQEPELLIKNPGFEQSEDFSLAIGTVENRSNYDFSQIDVWAILFDKDSKILGAGKIELKTVLSKEDRYFEISWSFSLADQVKDTDVVAKTNIFLDDNFMKRYGGEREKFQNY